MKLAAIIFCALWLAGNASAYFDGSASSVSGPHGYHGYDLDLTVGAHGYAFEPSWASYYSHSLGTTYRTYSLRAARETELMTVGVQGGYTPEANLYSNRFVGADITFSLTPGEGGRSRLAGPGAGVAPRGGEGVSRVDVGASARQTRHEFDGPSLLKTVQNQYSLFAGAKVLMLGLSASYTGYSYPKEQTTPVIDQIPGLTFVYSASPTSSVNARVDLPSALVFTPFVSYTGTKYRHMVKDSHAYMAGVYADFNMVAANLAWQLFDNGTSKHSFITLGAGLKF